MSMRILTNYSDAKDFLALAAEAGDANRSALGFWPASVYAEAALAGRLWVATSEDGTYLGHLLFGGKYPDLKVFQLFVSPGQRGKGVGVALIEALVGFGENHQYIAVTAKVAADLPANEFWEKMGFSCTRQIAGGRTSGRVINIRVRYIKSPLLFEVDPGSLSKSASISYGSVPALRSSVYALDVNGIIDLVKHRQRYDEICCLIRAGFNHLLRLVVTDEASRELLRSSASDVSGNLAVEVLSQVPALPGVERSTLEPLMEKLRLVVFPRRSRERRRALQDESDLFHLATCVHYRISGFITSEKAILRASEGLRRDFDLEVLSPSDFLEPEIGWVPGRQELKVDVSGGEISFSPFEESTRPAVERFLGSLGLPDEDVTCALEPGASGNARKRLAIVIDGELGGFASWGEPAKLRPQVNLFFFLDERRPNAERIIEHVLETVSRDSSTVGIYGIDLRHGAWQVRTREIALARGFRLRADGIKAASSLYKIALFGFADFANWKRFAADLRRLAQVDISEKIPSYEEASTSGVKVIHGPRRSPAMLKIFDLETIISPGLLLLPGRGGLIIPIRESYAEDLLSRRNPQTSFLPAQEALLRIEKAYFRKPRQLDLFSKGTPVVFYVSGGKSGKRRGPMAALCFGRITSTARVNVAEASLRYERQGVLSRSELLATADEEGGLHVFTFDNVVPFCRPVGFRRLKELGCIDGANLVTVRSVSYESLRMLLCEAFGLG